MSLHRWLQNLCSALAPRRGQRKYARRGLKRAPTHRPGLEALEDRRVPAFLAPVDYTVGWGPSEVKAADFNGDNILDLATLDTGTQSISVLLGNPDGTFQPDRYSQAGNGYPLVSLAVGDFNEDGKLDLATGSNYDDLYRYGIDDVIVLLGNGDGTFRPPAYLGTGLPALSVATGDLNGDDHLDLVLTSADNYSAATSVSVLLGHGDGTFALATTYDICLPSPALADFNGDGNTDVVGGNQLFLGNGDGTLREPSDLGIYSYSWAVADLDADGNLDLAGTTNTGAGYRMSVLLGHGDGTFQPVRSFTAGVDPRSVTAADVNGDDVLDLVMISSGAPDGYVTALLGSGDGSFGLPIATAVGFYPTSLVVADFNADGRPDAALTHGSSSITENKVSVLLNDGAWPPDSPAVSIRDVTVTEGNTGTLSATFTLTLSYATTIDVTVHYATTDITATAGSDYTAKSGTVVIPAGQTTGTITVAVNGDRLGEADETFAVNLTAATGATIGDGQGVGTILDNEPRISISDVTKKEGKKNQTTQFSFTVMLSAAYDQSVTVSFQTVNGTATTGDSDYVGRTGTITFAPGETTKTITIDVRGDNKKEADEEFYLELSGNSANSLITKQRGTGRILNDD